MEPAIVLGVLEPNACTSNTSIQIDDYESSDEEIFFGNVGEKENEIICKSEKRKTKSFRQDFRVRNNSLESNTSLTEDIDTSVGSCDISNDSLNSVNNGSKVLNRVSCVGSKQNHQPNYLSPTVLFKMEDEIEDVSLAFEKSLLLEEEDKKEEISFIKQDDLYVNLMDDDISTSNIVCESPYSNIDEAVFANSLIESSPEADFFDPDMIVDEAKLSFEFKPSNIHLIDALDLSQNDSVVNTLCNAPILPSPQRCLESLDLQTSIHVEDASKENESPSKVKHEMIGEVFNRQKRPRGLYWSPRPVNPVKSFIPLPNKSSLNKNVHSGILGVKKQPLKKWDIVSPVAKYIHDQPLPPLFKNVKPLREIPTSKTPIKLVKQEHSPTVSNLPAAEYMNHNGRKMGLSQCGSVPRQKKPVNMKIGSSSVPKIIRHKGPSKAIPWASHLRSDQSLGASPFGQSFRKTEIKTERAGDTTINKSVVEFVRLHRTDTLQ